MKSALTLTVVAWMFLFSIVLPSNSYSSERIDIKGIRIGMTREEIASKWGPSLRLEGLTIAGVRTKYLGSGNADLEFRDNKLDSFFFYFDSEKFETILAAVLNKFPKIKCEKSTVSNAMGANFEQTECIVSDSMGVLKIRRFADDIKTSTLSMMSYALMNEVDSKIKSDI